MRGASLADLHLGFRTYPSTTDGRNTREVDTEAAWNAAVEGVIEALDPGDIVTIAGDIFHHPRVSDFAKKAFLDGVWRMLDAGLIVVILQGNHDAGRTSDVLTPVMLAEFKHDNLFIVTTPERLLVGVGGKVVSIACFPYVTGEVEGSYRLEPDPSADVNVLVMHAAVKGAADGDTLPFFYGGGGNALDVGREAERWDVIACGDYHEFTRLHPDRLVFYSGSLERTSSNIWVEHAPKGWVLWDTALDPAESCMTLVEVPTREMKDITYSGEVTAAGVNDALWTIDDGEFLAGAIVRLKVDDFPKTEREHVDWALVRKIKSSCCHFNLDIRYAKAEGVSLDREDGGRRTLEEEAVAFFADDSPEVRKLALHHLGIEAEAEEVAS